MNALVAWLYGLLVVSSLIMVLAWGDAARQLAREHGCSLQTLIWSKPLLIAAGLTVHASFMAAAAGYRAYDILLNHLAVLGSEAAVQIVVLAGLGWSKVMFVWAGSIDERRRHIRWPWWAFLYALTLWALACWTWAATAAS